MVYVPKFRYNVLFLIGVAQFIGLKSRVPHGLLVTRFFGVNIIRVKEHGMNKYTIYINLSYKVPLDTDQPSSDVTSDKEYN